MTRLTPLEPASMSDEQRRVHDVIASGPRGSVRGPLAVWLRRPDLAEPAQALGRYCRYGSSLAPNLSELAILVVARFWGSEYEWRAHRPHALAAGVGPEAIEAIRRGGEPAFDDEEERIVHRFATVLHRDRRVPDDIYREAVAILGEDRTIDLVGVLGYYGLISMTINAFEVTHPDGGPNELDPVTA